MIPARNEEGNLEALLDSINDQLVPAHEVIVVDDGSTDRTIEIARQRGAIVVESTSLPEGWRGKPWACQQGAQAATADWLFFLDADTRLEAGALAKISALTDSDNQVYSICPYHLIQKPYEELSAFFNVLMLTGVNAFGNSPDAALFGQTMLISKNRYDEFGGHERVKGEVLENFTLAQHYRTGGLGRECYLGKGVVTMRMFPGGFPDLWRSWKKGFVSGAQGAPVRALVWSSIWITGAMFAMIGLLVLDLWWGGAAYLLYAAQSLWAFRLAGNFSALNALFFPCSLLFYQALFFTAVIERKRGMKTIWKGRYVD